MRRLSSMVMLTKSLVSSAILAMLREFWDEDRLPKFPAQSSVTQVRSPLVLQSNVLRGSAPT